jgi:hypothetical protein
VVEAWIAASIAVIGGGYSVVQALHRRISHIDTRLDRIELNLARDYVPRAEFMANQEKIESHMVRIEEKLDRMLERCR